MSDRPATTQRAPASYRRAPPVDADALQRAHDACLEALTEARYQRRLGDWHLERCALADALHAHQARIERYTRGSAGEASSAIEMDVLGTIDDRRSALAEAHPAPDLPEVPDLATATRSSRLSELREREGLLHNLSLTLETRATALEGATPPESYRARDWWALTHGPSLPPRPQRAPLDRTTAAPTSFPYRWLATTCAVIAAVVAVAASL